MNYEHDTIWTHDWRDGQSFMLEIAIFYCSLCKASTKETAGDGGNMLTDCSHGYRLGGMAINYQYWLHPINIGGDSSPLDLGKPWHDMSRCCSIYRIRRLYIVVRGLKHASTEWDVHFASPKRPLAHALRRLDTRPTGNCDYSCEARQIQTWMAVTKEFCRSVRQSLKEEGKSEDEIVKQRFHDISN